MFIFIKRYVLLIIIPVIAMSSSCGENELTETEIIEPMAKIKPKELSIHGHSRIDDYYWLNERDNPEVVEYLKLENNYLKQRMARTEELQAKLYDEIVGRIKQDDNSVPYFLNGYYYSVKYTEGAEYPVYIRQKGSKDAEEEILLDGNKMAEGRNFLHITGLRISPDNQILAYGIDTMGRREYIIQFKDLRTGELLRDEIPNTIGQVAWANDNRTLYYTVRDQTLRPYKIFKHTLGTAVSEDEQVYHEEDGTFRTFVYKSKSGEKIIIGSHSTLSSEYRFLDANDPGGEFTIIQNRQKDIEYSIAHHEDHFFILTNNKAKNFRVMKTPVTSPGMENWVEVVGHRQNVYIENIEAFGDFIVLEERENGLTNLRVIRLKDMEDIYIPFNDPAYVAYLNSNAEFNTQSIRFVYTSLTTPFTTYDFDVNTGSLKMLKQQEVLGDFSSDNYVSERIFATASDGTKIPMSLVYRKGLKKDGNNPLLQYGYGSYGASMDPYFSTSILSLLDRGFIYAISHIRGGSEMGREWYEAGKMLNKKNTFTDFIACSEFLIEQNYTRSEKLFAMGGSAGGLLMGAVVNMRPELYKGIIAAVPFVDIITTMLDESIPLTTGEYDEWGNPGKKEYYEYMLSYSPYDNIKVQDYPAMLITTGLHDSQVQYWEPAKWVAKLRVMKTDDNPLLLYTDMDAGHGGASGRFKRFKLTALEFAFMLDQLGITR